MWWERWEGKLPSIFLCSFSHLTHDISKISIFFFEYSDLNLKRFFTGFLSSKSSFKFIDLNNTHTSTSPTHLILHTLPFNSSIRFEESVAPESRLITSVLKKSTEWIRQSSERIYRRTVIFSSIWLRRIRSNSSSNSRFLTEKRMKWLIVSIDILLNEFIQSSIFIGNAIFHGLSFEKNFSTFILSILNKFIFLEDHLFLMS